MGLASMLGLFASILLHELAHSLVAKSYGMGIKSITLWLLGGLAELADEPPSPAAEFWIAIAGPLTSLALAIIFLLGYQVLPSERSFAPAAAVLRYLALVNAVVACFNLIPAFPLDGGRILRAWLWHAKGSSRTATRIASKIGGWFGSGLIGLGLAAAMVGFGLSSLWWVILGMFVRFAANSTLYQSETTYTLKGETVGKIMSKEPIAVSSDTNARQFLEDWVLKHHHKFYPVLDQGRLVGTITTQHLSRIDRD